MLREIYEDISGIPVKKAPPHKKAPPIREKSGIGRAFLFENSAEGRKFGGFESGNDDFLKENRVGRVRKGKIFPPAAAKTVKGLKTMSKSVQFSRIRKPPLFGRNLE